MKDKCLAAAVLAAVCFSTGVAATQARTAVPKARPRLVQTVSPDVYPRVIGRGWPASARIGLTARYRGMVARASPRSTRNGAFGVEIRGARWCSGLTVTATDSNGHRVTLRAAGASAACGGTLHDNGIALSTLTVRQMQAKQVNLDISRPVTPQAMRVGDVLYAFEPGTGGPTALLIPDQTHFRMVEQGSIAGCPAVAGCPSPPGYFWKLAATQPGEAVLTVSHLCRQSTPPCMLPDRALRIVISP